MDIPGYYFDPIKNKYFKIQRNHIAPPNSDYSIEAIRERSLKNEAEQIEQQQRSRERLQRLKHDRLVYHPLTSIQHRLNGARCAASYVTGYYGASIRRRLVLEPGVENSSYFALSGSHTDTLIVGKGRDRHTRGGPKTIVSLQREPDSTGRCAWTVGHRGDLAETVGRMGSMLLTAQGLLAWTEEGGK